LLAANRELVEKTFASRQTESKGGHMNTEEVAKKLVDYCRKGDWMKAIDDLYSKEIVSVEAREMENMPAEMRGIDQVRGKTEWWEKNMEVHSAKMTGPFVARDTFVVQFDVDVTEKASKKRMQMSEVGIYKVKDGKVAREEFLPLV
jgi:hypothetical protein